MNEKEAISRLRERLAELKASSENSVQDRKPVELDQQSVGRLSRMDALQVQAMAQEADRRRELEVRRIEAALVRLKAGDWGYCLNCGEEIEARRLALDPSVATCVGCASPGRGKP